mgnify:CR=1 FL=1
MSAVAPVISVGSNTYGHPTQTALDLYAGVGLSSAFLAEAVLLPSENFIGDQLAMVDPDAIHAARERVWMTTPYFVPGEAAMMALTSAGLAGHDMRLLVPRVSDSWLVTLAARSYFGQLVSFVGMRPL